MAKLSTLIAALFLALPASGRAQETVDPTRLEIDRGQLTFLLEQYQAVVQSTAYSDALRDEVRAQADMIRDRLRDGDFRAGDHVALLISRQSPTVWDTLVIESGPEIEVPALGPISLYGVLRSELEAHLSAEIGRYIQTPGVRARALIRLSVTGVRAPGFFTMPADLPLSEAVMLAGGPGPGSDPGRIRIERGQEVLWSVEELVNMVASGSTLDDLGLHAGDRIVLPVDLQAAAGGGQSRVMQQVIQSASYVLIPLLLGAVIN
jgi:protein involved in polysaccharide export with SLBB domain